MNRTLARLASAIGAVAVLVITNPAGAQVYHLGPERVYPPPPMGSPGWRETPMFAPDAPPPRYFDNYGIPDHQNGTRNGG